MRICLAVRYFENVGGMEKFSLTFARFLADRGHQVRILAFRGRPMDGVQFLQLPEPAFVPRARRDWRTASDLAQALRHEQADVTFGEQKMWGCDILRPAGGVEDEYWKLHFRFRRRVPLPPGLRFLAPKRYFDIAAERRGYADPHLRLVLVNSDLVRHQILQNYPGLDGRVRVVHEGVTTRPEPAGSAAEAVRRRILVSNGLSEHGTTLLFVGHDFRRKGLRQTLEAMAIARARTPDWPLQLLVLGRDRTPSYRRLAHRLGIEHAVAFAGSISPPDPYFAACDAFVLPTFYDPCANVVLEALGLGIPVITTRQNGASEVLSHGVDGWILDHPTDLQGLAAAMRELHDPQRLAAAKAAALQLAARHSIRDKLTEVEALFQGVADQKRRQAR